MCISKNQPFAFIPLLMLMVECAPPKPSGLQGYEVASRWASMTLLITKNTPANSPTFASRAFGYIGLTMYESVVHASPHHRSLAGQLSGLTELPQPEKGKKYNWALALNAGQAQILKSIYVQTSDENKAKIDSLQKVIQQSVAEEEETVLRSIGYGQAVAAAIFEWSKTDGGHRGYLANFDSEAIHPNRPGSWRAPFFAQTISRFPLHPHWGNNRTFLPTDSAWKMPAFLTYDSSATSEYYKQFDSVYKANQTLTQEQKEIAVWWNDDPSDTFTPPGHSYNLARIVVTAQKPDLVSSAETFARVGLAVADAFVVCWRMKYVFFSERPSTYISEHIDEQWEPFWPDPPFPAFPSGHATQAGAVATVMADMYGDSLAIVDNTHVGLPENKLRHVPYKQRTFSSFWQLAEETAYSRFLGGIHCSYDNEIGLQQGKLVGNHVNQLKWQAP